MANRSSIENQFQDSPYEQRASESIDNQCIIAEMRGINIKEVEEIMTISST
jgi:hypothetical protein